MAIPYPESAPPPGGHRKVGGFGNPRQNGQVSPEEPVAPPATPPPSVPDQNADANSLPPDAIGDIPPPPIPPPPMAGTGVAGIPGTEGSTFALPGTSAAVPFHTAAFAPRPRFGPGAPMVGGSTAVSGLGDSMNPDAIGELLRQLAAARGGQ